MAESSDLAVDVKGVYKKYGKGKKANHVLKGLDMEVPHNTMLVSVQLYQCYSRIYQHGPKANNYKLLVSRPGETKKSMRAGGYYYYCLEYYYCTIQH